MKPLLYLALLAMVGCSAPIDRQTAIEKLRQLPEFQTPFYAPLHVGREVLTGDNHKNPDTFLAQRYGQLVDKGLIEAKIESKNSWRTVTQIALTDQGRRLEDPRRATDDRVYVQVCNFQIDSITQFELLDPDGKTARCRFIFSETDITPLGEFLGFSPGRQHTMTKTITR